LSKSRPTTRRRAIVFVLSGAVLAALYFFYISTGPAERVILLPQPDGTPSAVVVKSKKSGATYVLDRPYSVATVGETRIGSETTDETAVKTRYSALFDAFPERPRSYRLYFETGGTKLTPESEKRLPILVGVLKDLKDLPAAELILVGHADEVGSSALNDALSRRRAARIAAMLKAAGVDVARVAIVGRGSREPLVPVGEGAPEARNRRVEIRLK
jgi:outer membrane protein OmpA-like peptidoglycan-associated protein